jgi:pyruvate dehydrogenase E1 component alpha subunit
MVIEQKVIMKKQKLIDMYTIMVRIRAFEERVAKEFERGNIPSHAHLYIGQEAIAAGACATLRPDDYIVSSHRGHGHLIAKGGKTDRMFAELYGKKTGYCKGKGGTMHIADVDAGIMGANAIVGAGITIAGVVALSAKLRKTEQVCLCFFGDGASNTSRFHEGINLASILELPVVYVVENNMYAISVSSSYAMNVPNIADRASAYGIPGKVIDGTDVLAVHEAVGAAVARAREGEGPSIVEGKTYRWYGHYTGDLQTYRSNEEIEELKNHDPITRLEKYLIDGILTEKDTVEINRKIAEEIEEAVRFAQESPFPEPDEVFEDVYA